jgi:hypothetical protein
MNVGRIVMRRMLDLPELKRRDELLNVFRAKLGLGKAMKVVELDKNRPKNMIGWFKLPPHYTSYGV